MKKRQGTSQDQKVLEAIKTLCGLLDGDDPRFTSTQHDLAYGILDGAWGLKDVFEGFVGGPGKNK